MFAGCRPIKVYVVGIMALVTLNCLDSGSISFTEVCPHNCSCQAKPTLLCNYSGFQQVPFDLPAYTHILYLDMNNIQSVRPAAFANLKNITQIMLGGNHMEDRGISPLSFKGVRRLDVLELSYNNLTRVPRFIPANVTSLYLIGNMMTEVKNDEFSHMTYISYLALSFNRILTIDLLSFAPLKASLLQIDLMFNNLTCDGIHNGMIFSGLDCFIDAGLRFNPLRCIPEKLPASLTALDLVGANITKIQYGTLNHLTNLVSIGLWENSIEEIEDNAFAGLSSLTYMDANSNQIRELNNKTLRGLKNLGKIYLYINAIEVVTDGAFEGMLLLTELWLSDNKLTSISTGFMNILSLPALNYVDVTDNPFQCDCKMRWFKIYQEKNDKVQYPHLITCVGPARLKGKTWDELSYKNFTC